jgi:hypothetical protein
VDGFARLVIDRVNDGWSCHLMTFPFVQLPGPRSAVIQAMKDEIQRVYSTFVTRTNRKPRTASPDELPVLVAALDAEPPLPVRSAIISLQSKCGRHRRGSMVRCLSGLTFCRRFIGILFAT